MSPRSACRPTQSEEVDLPEFLVREVGVVQRES